jgi:hypothetical protein
MYVSIGAVISQPNTCKRCPALAAFQAPSCDVLCDRSTVVRGQCTPSGCRILSFRHNCQCPGSHLCAQPWKGRRLAREACRRCGGSAPALATIAQIHFKHLILNVGGVATGNPASVGAGHCMCIATDTAGRKKSLAAERNCARAAQSCESRGAGDPGALMGVRRACFVPHFKCSFP